MGKSKIRKIKQKFCSERGNSLLLAVVAALLLSTLSVVSLSVVVTDNRVTANSMEASKAVWLAQAGVERAVLWLREQDPPPDATDPFVLFQNDSLGDGTYSVEISPLSGNSSHYIKKYDIRASGNEGALSKVVQVRVKSATFAKYGYLSGTEGQYFWFVTGEIFEGPVHSNDQINISGSPVFEGEVTSSASSFGKDSNYNPTFSRGYRLGVPQIVFPTTQTVLDNYYTENSSAPLKIDASNDKHADLEFMAGGDVKYSVWHLSSGITIYDVKDADVKLTDTNGLIYVEGDATVKGIVKGQVTLIATEDITIVDDIKYSKVEPDAKPTADCVDLLGIVAGGNIVIADNAANDKDVRIDGALLALGTSLKVENYDSGPPRGELTIYGSLCQVARGPVGTIRSDGTTTGYDKDYHYDARFLNGAPPYFPRTGEYELVSWTEVSN